VHTGSVKNYFAYHGSGRDPNFENWTNSVDCDDPRPVIGKPSYLKTTNFQLKLNGQSRHLDGQGISRDYLMNRLMPMIHSAAREDYLMVAQHSTLEEFLAVSSGSRGLSRGGGAHARAPRCRLPREQQRDSPHVHRPYAPQHPGAASLASTAARRARARSRSLAADVSCASRRRPAKGAPPRRWATHERERVHLLPQPHPFLKYS
jgi:hypothetical protein